MNQRQQFFYQSICQMQDAFLRGFQNVLLVARRLQQQFQQYTCAVPGRFPHQFCEHTHTIDHEARNIYPLDAPNNLTPVAVTGDGNCFDHSVFLFLVMRPTTLKCVLGHL